MVYSVLKNGPIRLIPGPPKRSVGYCRSECREQLQQGSIPAQVGYLRSVC